MIQFPVLINLVALLFSRKKTVFNIPFINGIRHPHCEPSADIDQPDLKRLPELYEYAENRIYQDYSVTQKWHTGWRRDFNEITEAVIHHTDGTGNIDSLKNWMLGGEFKDLYRKGVSLFHFAIDREGAIWEAGPVSRWWYHSCSGKHDRFTVGIEIIHKDESFTGDQYRNLSWLLFEHLPRLCPSLTKIVSHDCNYHKYGYMMKGCPGPDFDWERLEKEMKMRNIIFIKDGNEEYTIKFPE